MDTKPMPGARYFTYSCDGKRTNNTATLSIRHNSMATIHKRVTNTKTGQTYLFLQTAESTNGELLEIESVFAPFSKEPPRHYHPAQAEDFTILEGELSIKLDNKKIILKKGETLHVPPGQVHAMWNESATPAVANWQTRPAMNSEFLFETFAHLANDNKTDETGRPSLLQVAVSVPYFSNVFRMVNPPEWVQAVLFAVFKPIARMMGYKPVYQKS